MNPFDYITKYPERTVSILGVTHEDFKEITDQAMMREKELEELQEKTRKRLIRKGGGRQSLLKPEMNICLCLVYLRQMPTFEMLGMAFDVSKTTAHEYFHYWLPILKELLPASLIEEFKNAPEGKESLQAILQDKELLVDSSEQGRERPSDNEEQKRFYSNKKARHTFKSQFISLPKAQDIVDVLPGERGPEADITLFRSVLSLFSEEQSFLGDKAYIGESQIITPKKKPKGGELTLEEREANKVLSQRRIYIEHLIRRIKIFRITQERFRLKSRCYNKVIHTVCGLVRLRMGTFSFA